MSPICARVKAQPLPITSATGSVHCAGLPAKRKPVLIPSAKRISLGIAHIPIRVISLPILANCGYFAIISSV